MDRKVGNTRGYQCPALIDTWPSGISFPREPVPVISPGPRKG